ncbi:MAG TPA: MASE4 domain-containing protein [Xanthobacteraceae bacterium]|nr:MASE4 domain-containing protein [Xanthobacteraceae bacterium]
MTREELDTETRLVNLPPTSRQRYSALAIAMLLLVGFLACAPLAHRTLPRIDAFLPTAASAISVTDFITSVLLFAHFSIYRSRALLALASGYLYTSLIVIPNALTFPGAFSPTGLLGASRQSAGWLYFFWHSGFAAALLIYASLKSHKAVKDDVRSSSFFAIGWSVAIVVVLVWAVTLLATAGADALPQLFLDEAHFAPAADHLFVFMLLICSFAFFAMWSRRRSVLDYWLTVVALAQIFEVALSLAGSGRFSLGFYANRVFSLVTSATILVILLAETTKLYARLARSNLMLQHERNNKLMNMEAMVASISHEVRQPLTSIVANSNTARRFLGRQTPNLTEVRSALDRIESNSHRASQIFDSFRALFGRGGQSQEAIDVNEMALEVLQILRGELKENAISTRIELTPELPLIMGHKGQLQEVLVNLIHNAMEAMSASEDGHRTLQVKTARHGGSAILLTVEDSGPGIDPENADSIFDAFVSMKPQGMGLGLAICRMIIERHNGQISASPAQPRGSVLRVVLPVR